MENEIWKSSIDRRDFLRGSLGVAIGAAGLLETACGGGSTATQPVATPTPNFAKAQIDGDLNFFNWSQYLSPDVIKGFENQYGVKVHQTYFDNMQGMLAKLTAGVSYDITFPTMDYTRKLIGANVLQAIDHSQFTNWNEVPAYFHNPWYDKNALYSVPYAIWTTGICWRTDQVSGMTGSWNDLWNHPEASGKIFLLDDFQETIGMSLLRLKYDLNSGDRAQLDKAVAELLALKPKLRGFSTNDIPNLVDGTAFIHHAWSGDVWQVVQQASNPQNFSYQTCKEGVPTGNDTMVIPKNAQHPGTALKFIDWMLHPENAKTNVNYFGYPQVTTTGIDAYTTLVAQYPYLNLSLDTAIHGLREIAPDGAKLQLWDSEWAKVKAG